MSCVNYFHQDRDLSLPGLSAGRESFGGVMQEGFPNPL